MSWHPCVVESAGFETVIVILKMSTVFSYTVIDSVLTTVMGAGQVVKGVEIELAGVLDHTSQPSWAVTMVTKAATAAEIKGFMLMIHKFPNRGVRF